MRSRRWRSIQWGLPESAHGSPELVKHASLVEVDGMSRNRQYVSQGFAHESTTNPCLLELGVCSTTDSSIKCRSYKVKTAVSTQSDTLIGSNRARLLAQRQAPDRLRVQPVLLCLAQSRLRPTVNGRRTAWPGLQRSLIGPQCFSAFTRHIPSPRPWQWGLRGKAGEQNSMCAIGLRYAVGWRQRQ
jgi:hypothetical protein